MSGNESLQHWGDFTALILYFVLTIGIGIWVSANVHDLYLQKGLLRSLCKAKPI